MHTDVIAAVIFATVYVLVFMGILFAAKTIKSPVLEVALWVVAPFHQVAWLYCQKASQDARFIFGPLTLAPLVPMYLLGDTRMDFVFCPSVFFGLTFIWVLTWKPGEK